MKKIWKYLFLLFSASSSAQITLDTVVHPWNAIGYDFYPVQISSTETKYYVQDTLTNTFNLYNMDFTPFMTNIAVPEPYNPFVYNYEVIYLSRSLFDCDTSSIEFAYTAIGSALSGATKSFYIMRTDGTQLFKLDSAYAPYCFGCLNGSQDTKPIINTSAGAKLFLYYPSNTNNLHIYSLCGTLPKIFDLTNSNVDQTYITIFPNPTSGSLTFEINLPNNMEEFELVIVDNSGREAKHEKINFSNHRCVIDVMDFSNGTYYYSLCTKRKAYQSGKFILNK
ncbi:MAG: T9SS type A sorting domain-containing protein [Bacteroidota bacterium]